MNRSQLHGAAAAAALVIASMVHNSIAQATE